MSKAKCRDCGEGKFKLFDGRCGACWHKRAREAEAREVDLWRALESVREWAEQRSFVHHANSLQEALEEYVQDGLRPALLDRLEFLEEALRSVEWCGWDLRAPFAHICPSCRSPKVIGHEPGCLIGLALRRSVADVLV